MGIIDAQSAEITIPADFLEDVRSALVAELDDDSDRLRTNQAELLSGGKDRSENWARATRADRDSAVSFLRNDLRMLDELLGATGDTKVIVERDMLFHVLEAMGRLLTERLREEMGYGPLDMGTVLELGNRLRWTAEQAIRIYPECVQSSEAAA
jgi:hypothetical protein